MKTIAIDIDNNIIWELFYTTQSHADYIAIAIDNKTSFGNYSSTTGQEKLSAFFTV